MSIKPYPKYKDSGVEWLGMVPEGWEVLPSKWRIRSAAGGTSIKGLCANEPSDGLYPGFSASGQDIWLEGYDFDVPGIVLSAVGARCGKTFKANGEWGVVANTHCLFPRQNSDRDFLWFLTNKDDWWEKGGSAQPFIKVSDSLARKWAFPTLAEQSAIASFLDHETAKIDALIAEQEKLIELLKEKRSAVISHAVTKGLNPDVKMKDSGVEWLGMVPEGWEVKPLKAVASHNDETIDESHDADSEILYVDISGVDASKGIQMKEALRFGEAPSRARRIVKNGDVIVSTVRTYLRAIAPVKNPEPNLVVSTGFAVIRAKDRLDPHFSPYVLSAAHFIEQVIARSVGVSYPAINASDLVRIPVPLPTLAEQSAIASFLDHETSKIDALTTEAQQGINLLEERRSALISAAVTGQIDVRDFNPSKAA